MLLENEQIEELREELSKFLEDKLLEILCNLNRQGNLEEFFNLIGAKGLISQNQDDYRSNPCGYIVVLGKSDVDKETLLSVAKKLGIDKSKLKLCIEYKDTKKFNIKIMRYNSDYAVVICGPTPHKGISTGEYNSIISHLEQEEGYPHVERLGGKSLHISKSNFKNALEKLIQNNKIQTN